MKPAAAQVAEATAKESLQTRPNLCELRQWYFCMKAHIGVDAQSGLLHTGVGTTANVSDLNVAGQLLHGEDLAVFCDAALMARSRLHSRTR